mmetsp:Transcript_7159/g.18542  ORF Transcript_7159/g.18542 Transcript_7159/m.18542 type:complete len:322 (-) Transcript_7159:2691-3656(-)
MVIATSRGLDGALLLAANMVPALYRCLVETLVPLNASLQLSRIEVGRDGKYLHLHRCHRTTVELDWVCIHLSPFRYILPLFQHHHLFSGGGLSPHDPILLALQRAILHATTWDRHHTHLFQLSLTSNRRLHVIYYIHAVYPIKVPHQGVLPSYNLAVLAKRSRYVVLDYAHAEVVVLAWFIFTRNVKARISDARQREKPTIALWPNHASLGKRGGVEHDEGTAAAGRHVIVHKYAFDHVSWIVEKGREGGIIEVAGMRAASRCSFGCSRHANTFAALQLDRVRGSNEGALKVNGRNTIICRHHYLRASSFGQGLHVQHRLQ